MVSYTARARGSFCRHCNFGRRCHVFTGGTHQPVCASTYAAQVVIEIDSTLFLICRSPLGKLALGNRLTKMVTRHFELDCGYHSHASHDDIDPRSRSKATNDLADDMQKELSAQIRHSKSLSAGPLGLRAWISLLINWMSQQSWVNGTWYELEELV